MNLWHMVSNYILSSFTCTSVLLNHRRKMRRPHHVNEKWKITDSACSWACCFFWVTFLNEDIKAEEVMTQSKQERGWWHCNRVNFQLIQSLCSGWLRLRCTWTKIKKWLVNVVLPSTTWRQVMCNTSNNSGDGALTMVPLCRGLSGTRFTLGRWWKSRGQVEQTMDVTGGLIYYLYLIDDSC